MSFNQDIFDTALASARTPRADMQATARIAYLLTDLTSLNKEDNEASIDKLCQQAKMLFGHVYALCIYPEFLEIAQRFLPDHHIQFATVANFPAGNDSKLDTCDAIQHAYNLGFQEVDVVFPYQRYLAGDKNYCHDFIQGCKDTALNNTLKVILETSEYPDANSIYDASELIIDAGADFIKTSTGKSKHGATLEAATAMLMAIKDSGKGHIGFKASGGIKTVEQAGQYLNIAEYLFSENWIDPDHFRFGASSLVDDIALNL